MAINVNENGTIKNVAVPSMPYAKFMFNLYQDGYNTPRKMGMDASYVKAISATNGNLSRSDLQEFLTYKLDFAPKFMIIKPICMQTANVIETDADSRINVFIPGSSDNKYYYDRKWMFMVNGADISYLPAHGPDSIAYYYDAQLFENPIRSGSNTRKGFMFYTFKLDGDLLRCYSVLGRGISGASADDTYLLDNYFLTMTTAAYNLTCFEVEAFN